MATKKRASKRRDSASGVIQRANGWSAPRSRRSRRFARKARRASGSCDELLAQREELLLRDLAVVDVEHRGFLERLACAGDRERAEVRVARREGHGASRGEARRRGQRRPLGEHVRAVELSAGKHDRAAHEAALLVALDAEDLDALAAVRVAVANEHERGGVLRRGGLAIGFQIEHELIIHDDGLAQRRGHALRAEGRAVALLRVLLDAPLGVCLLDEAERVALVVAEDVEEDRGGVLRRRRRCRRVRAAR